MVAQIKQLSAHIAERLRSDLVVTSLTQGIEELVSNSIDAGATEIKVVVKPSEFSFLVEDDGCGIPPASFGQLATRHATSKLESMSDLVKGVDTLGFRGEALASLAQAANLEITSKAKGTFETHTKTLQGGDVLRNGLALEQRTKHGTRVVVRDLFFNRPVRRKHLTGTGHAAFFMLKKELDVCREHMLRLALLRPAVGFTLVNSTRKSTILCLKRGRTEKDVLPLVFGQRLVQHGMHCEGPVEAELYISRPLEGLSAKLRQYMYVNSRYVANDAASKLLNTLFQQVLQDLTRRGCEQQGAARRFPAFVCHISCPPGMLDVTAQPDKTAVQFTEWAPVLAAVRSAAMHAWHQYVPHALLTDRRAHASAPAALLQPQNSAQPVLMSAAVGPHGLTERTAVEDVSVLEGARTASCGGAAAAGGAQEGDGLRAHKRVRFSLDEGTGADRMEAVPAREQHAAASTQPRTHGCSEWGVPWLSAPDYGCEGALQCADKPSAQPDISHWHDRRIASCGRSFWSREERDSEASDGSGHIAQHGAEEAQLAECRFGSMQEADMADAWGSMGSPVRELDVLECLQSPKSAAFAAQLPQSPTLDTPPAARAGPTGLHWQPQLSFRVRRRPSEPPQLHPDLNLKAEALEDDRWCLQAEQAHLNSSSEAPDGGTLQCAPGSMSSPGRHDMATGLGDWMQTDDGVSDELAAALCSAAERQKCSARDCGALGSGPLAAVHNAEQQEQQHHMGKGSLHEKCSTEQIVGPRGGRCQQPGGRRRASSAPPHHRPRMRAAHTNPIFSLRSSGGSRDAGHALPDQLPPSEAACQANEAAVSAHKSEQTSEQDSDRRRKRRRMQTYSGVCSRPRTTNASIADPPQLSSEGPFSLQESELHGDAAPVQANATEASHADGRKIKVSGPTKKRSTDQSAQAEEEVGEAVRVQGGALMQAPARRHRPQRGSNGNDVGHSSGTDILASIVGAEHAEPAVKVRQGEVPPLQPGIDQVDSPAQIGRAQLLQCGESDIGGNAAGLDTVAVRGAGEAVARSGGSMAELLREWVNPACTSGQRQVPDLASLACGNLLGLVPAAITKESLDAARPLRQVDRKFVPLVCGSQLAIMDQHAADERVQLEQLTGQVVGPRGLPVSSQSCMLSPSQPLDITPAEAHLLDGFRASVEAWGWRWELVPADGARFGAAAAAGPADGARLTHAAVVLGTPLNGIELQTYLHQLQSSSGSAEVPPGVLRVLASKACHSAIRFGDELDAGQCEELLSNLKRTRSWHCCAHGRPTVAPLVCMSALHRVLGLRGCVT